MNIEVNEVRTGDYKTVALPEGAQTVFRTVGKARKYYKELLNEQTILLTYTEKL